VQDPWEIKNLSKDPKMFKVIEGLRKQLIQYRDEWDELNTYWGKVWWGGFLKSNPQYRDERTQSLAKPGKIQHYVSQLRLWIKNDL